MTGSNRGDGFDPNAYPNNPPSSPTTPGGSPTTPPAFGIDNDSTRSIDSVPADDHTRVYSRDAVDSTSYDSPSPYAGSSYGSSSIDDHPEERFITGSTADSSVLVATPVDEGVAKRGFHIPVLGGWLLGILRILLGWQFFWAFLDKTFGLGYSTTSDNSWINGGKPTQGFLTGVVNDPNNPFSGLFENFIGKTWVDWLFMAGLAGIGIVLLLGLGTALTWVAAISGIAMYTLMYLAEWPAGHRAGPNVDSAATNPFLDDHVLNAVLLLALAVCNAGAYLGLAKAWRSSRAIKDT